MAKRQQCGRPSRLLYLLASLAVVALTGFAFFYGMHLEARAKRDVNCGCLCASPRGMRT